MTRNPLDTTTPLDVPREEQVPALVFVGMLDEMRSPAGMRARRTNGRFARLRLPVEV